MKISYDADVDALYIQLRDLKPGQANNKDLGHGIIADFGADGLLAGLEILDASKLLGTEKENIILELAPAKHEVA